MILGMMAAVALMGAGDPDGIVVTAPVGRGAPPVAVEAPAVELAPRQSVAHGLTTDEQIEQWINQRRESDPGLPFGEIVEDDGKVHGEFSVGIGTGGYRDYGGTVSVPMGSGRLDLHYRSTENDYLRGYDRYYRDYDGMGAADRVDPWGHTPVPASTPRIRPDRPSR